MDWRIDNMPVKSYRFKDWEADLMKQYDRHKNISLVDVQEFLSFTDKTGDHQVAIRIGKNTYEAWVDDSVVGMSGLRTIYTNHKDEFAAMLESLTEQTDQIMAASEAIFQVVTVDSIPEAVMRRMQGDKVEDNPVELIQDTCKRNLEKLCGELSNHWPIADFISLEFQIPCQGKSLEVHLEERRQRVDWGDIHGDRMRFFSSRIDNAEDAMYFNLNFVIIRKKILSLIRQFQEVR